MVSAVAELIRSSNKQSNSRASALTESVEKARAEATKKQASNAEQEKINAMDEAARKVAAEKVVKMLEEADREKEAVKLPNTAEKRTAVEPAVMQKETPISPSTARTVGAVANDDSATDNGRDKMVVFLAIAAVITPLLQYLQQ